MRDTERAASGKNGKLGLQPKGGNLSKAWPGSDGPQKINPIMKARNIRAFSPCRETLAIKQQADSHQAAALVLFSVAHPV